MKMNFKGGKTILSVSIILSLLISLAGYVGIADAGLYEKETFNWRVQSVGQDMINLFIIIPALLLTAVFRCRKNYIAGLLWMGVIIYIVYTFIIYSFSVHFNRLFVVYCLILGISFFSFAWFIYGYSRNIQLSSTDGNNAIKVTGVFFIVLSLVFYFFWLGDVVPAIIYNRIPKGLSETGLVTNPVHVIDLSVFLPAVFITGILLLRRKPAGFLFAVIILAFLILMNITIGWLAFLMRQKGIASDLSVTMIMAVLTVFCFLLLAWNIKHIKMKIS